MHGKLICAICLITSYEKYMLRTHCSVFQIWNNVHSIDTAKRYKVNDKNWQKYGQLDLKSLHWIRKIKKGTFVSSLILVAFSFFFFLSLSLHSIWWWSAKCKRFGSLNSLIISASSNMHIYRKTHANSLRFACLYKWFSCLVRFSFVHHSIFSSLARSHFFCVSIELAFSHSFCHIIGHRIWCVCVSISFLYHAAPLWRHIMHTPIQNRQSVYISPQILRY